MNAQHVMLDALEKVAYENMSQEEFCDASANAPQSVVFFPSEFDDYDDADAIRDVGKADVGAKIRYWSLIVEQLTEGS